MRCRDASARAECARAAQRWGKEWVENNLNPEKRAALQGLNSLAEARGQTLAQLALAWILRLPSVTSALIGASSIEQLEQNLAALQKPDFTAAELEEIDRYATDSGINIWAASSES